MQAGKGKNRLSLPASLYKIMAVELKNLFPIAPETTSVRIFFGKIWIGSRVWHLFDAALGYSQGYGKPPLYMALHGGQPHNIATKADTLGQAQILTGVNDEMCQRCLEEFDLALPIIKEKKLLKFD